MKDFLIKNSETVAEQFTQWGIKYVFTGHEHGNDVAAYTGKNGEQVYDVLTTALSSYPLEYRSVVMSSEGADLKMQKIDRCNKRRIVRSLEVIEQTGRSFTELSRCTPPPFEVLKLGLHWERQALFARIDLRLKEMMAQGWPEEAERLYREGFAEDLRCLRILGYPELLDAIEGKITLPEAEELIRLATHRFAKRQQTWFKKEPELHTLSAGEEAYSEACRLIREFLRH